MDPYAPSPPPQPNPSVLPPAQMPNTPHKHPSRLPLMLSLGAGVLLIIIILVVLLVGGSKPASKKAATTTSTPDDQVSQKATSLDLQQLNNAMSQQISGLDNGKDFSADQLSDKTLNIGQ